GVLDPNRGRQVKDDVERALFPPQPIQGRSIGHAPLDDPKSRIRGELLQIGGVRIAEIVQDDDSICRLAEQTRDKASADEARPAGNQILHGARWASSAASSCFKRARSRGGISFELYSL